MADTQVAKKANSALSIPAEDLLADVGRGLEKVSSDDMTIPRLAIIQSGSPQRKKKDDKYIEEADEGMVFNTVSNALYKDTFYVVPCEFEKLFIEWIPRESGGGLVTMYNTSNKPQAKKEENGRRFLLENGNQLVDTAQHYVMVIGKDGSYEPAVMSMSSSLLTVSRNWVTRMKLQRENVNGKLIEPPTFYYKWPVTTIEKTNSDGSWFIYKIGNPEPIGDADLYQAAKSLSDSVRKGVATADVNTDNDNIQF